MAHRFKSELDQELSDELAAEEDERNHPTEAQEINWREANDYSDEGQESD